jgi:hypothetical protein
MKIDIDRIGNNDTTPVKLPLGNHSASFHFTIPQRPVKLKFIDDDEVRHQPHYGSASFLVLDKALECHFLVMDVNTNELLGSGSISHELLEEQVAHAIKQAYRDQTVVITEVNYITSLTPKKGSTTPEYFCRHCAAPRNDAQCWKCNKETVVPIPNWSYPELPDVEPIRKIARELGYAIAVHGSQERDLDLIAVPWVTTAVSHLDLIDAICKGIVARQIGPVENKPFQRIAVTIQIDGFYKPIDLSIVVPV